MEKEQVSVIIPVYNVEAYVRKCIKSICDQTFNGLEIILVDDGSTDFSGEICDEWAQKDSRIRVIHKENGGLADARNVGIQAANGSWLMFVDSDDTITQDNIQQLYEAATAYNCEIAVCNMVRIYDDGATEPFYHPVSELTLWDGVQRFETMKQPSVCNKLFRADLFEDVQFPKGKYYEDTFIYHILAHHANRIVLTGQDGYLYLSRRESILGHQKYSDRYFDFVEAVYARMTYLMEYQIDYYAEEACMSMYAAVSNGEKYMVETADNTKKIALMRYWYRIAYGYLMKCPDVRLKQRIRLILLRYCPVLHSKIY